jgi:hypothetical protein
VKSLEKYEKELKRNGYKIVESCKKYPWVKAVKLGPKATT